MTIQEQYNKFNEIFDEFTSQMTKVDAKLIHLDYERQAKKSEIKKRAHYKRQALLQKKEELMMFYRIASANTNQKLVTTTDRKPPDLKKLNLLIYKIDNESTQDNNAAEIVRLLSSYVSWVEEEIRKLEIAEYDALKAVDQSVHCDKVQINSRKQLLIQDYCQRMEQEKIRDFSKKIRNIRARYQIDHQYYQDFFSTQKCSQKMLLGFQKKPLRVPVDLKDSFKEMMKEFYEERTGNGLVPLSYQANKCEGIYYWYTEANKEDMRGFVRVTILNLLRYTGFRGYQITLLDSVYYNGQILGQLYGLSRTRRGIVDQVPENEEQYRRALQRLAEYYHNLEEKLGTESLSEYNSRQTDPKKILAGRLLIINRSQGVQIVGENAGLAYLLNNAAKLGILVLCLEQYYEERNNSFLRGKLEAKVPAGAIFIKGKSDCSYEIRIQGKMELFVPLLAKDEIDNAWLQQIIHSSSPNEIGTQYSKRYNLKRPIRSKGMRQRTISLPFAIDADDNPISAEFANNCFAAYLMGASGSGKSTLIHTLIASLVMNYHPDEVELWLLDFKMMEFETYIKNPIPHVRYILLEKSKDLIFDVLDRMTEILEARERIFSQNNWDKLEDVPIDIYMPAIFVIIDEFAQMSQILKTSAGMGDLDYRLKLENLLTKGRAVGFRFIFASQTYTTGVSGLTETACKQIQMRFAMKNTSEEIKQTLMVKTGEISPQTDLDIQKLQVFETLFHIPGIGIRKYRNMYLEKNEIQKLMNWIREGFQPVDTITELREYESYLSKNAVYVDGKHPVTFKNQWNALLKVLNSKNTTYYENETEIPILLGVPCSFNRIQPIYLTEGFSQNIVLAGGSAENKSNILLSILKSCKGVHLPVELWASTESLIFKKYARKVFVDQCVRTDPEEIVKRFDKLMRRIKSKKKTKSLIIVMGYGGILSDLEAVREINKFHETYAEEEKFVLEESSVNLDDILNQLEKEADVKKRQSLIQNHNSKVEGRNTDSAINMSEIQSVEIDMKNSMKQILKIASKYGTHFVFCMDTPKEFEYLKMNSDHFAHKIGFRMNREDSMNILENRSASDLDEGMFVYCGERNSMHMRPHLHAEIECNGWKINENGQVVQTSGVMQIEKMRFS